MPLLAGIALLQSLREAVLSSTEPEVSEHKLAWWRQELAHAQHSPHPAFEALRDSGLSAHWDWDATDAWCVKLGGFIQPNAPAVSQTLWRQLRELSGLQLLWPALQAIHGDVPSDHGEADINSMESIAAAGWLLTQINRLSIQPAAQRWLPLSLRARHGLQLDQSGPQQGNSTHSLAAAVSDLLDLIQPVLRQHGSALPALSAGSSTGNSLPVLLAMQRALVLACSIRLQRAPGAVWQQPQNTIGLLGAWRCWRAVRALQ